MFTFTRLDDVPRSVPIIHFFILTAALIGGRVWRRSTVQRQDLGGAFRIKHAREQHVILVGVSRLAWFYIRLLDTFAADRRRVVGLIDINRALVGRTMFGQVVLGCPDDAAALIDDFASHGMPITGFVVCDQRPAAVEAYFGMLRELCEARSITLTDLAKELGLDSESEMLAEPIFTPVVSTYLRFRPYLDAAISIFVLAIFLPVLVCVAVGVLLSMGPPVVFWQRRIGRYGFPIFVYKFRSMRNAVDRDGNALANAQRSSRFGEFLRATRLDELPQLWNVARRDMALIGPRPLLPEDQPDRPELRLSTPPGITGWAQIHGGKLVSVKDKNAMDEYYVRNASVLLDLKIVLKTVRTILLGDKMQATRDN